MSHIKFGATTHKFITLRGRPITLGQRVEVITRPDVDGHSYRRMGQRSEPYTMVGIKDIESGGTAVGDLEEQLQDLVGRLVEVVDDFDRMYLNVMLLDVRPLSARHIETPVGGVNTIGTAGSLLRIAFTLQNTKVPV